MERMVGMGGGVLQLKKEYISTEPNDNLGFMAAVVEVVVVAYIRVSNKKKKKDK